MKSTSAVVARTLQWKKDSSQKFYGLNLNLDLKKQNTNFINWY